MQNQEISSLIPQKAPFVIVDKLLAYDEFSAKTSFKVTAENVLVVNGELTEAGLLENIAQTAAARAGYVAINENKPVTAGYIGAVKNFEVFDLPKPGDNLITEVRIENQVFDVTIISGEISCNGVVIAKSEMNVFNGK
jgi:predicted hotdog family 3-hydroxylacyl-ACP dehydratase